MATISDGKSIYLREFNESDLSKWASWFNNSAVTRFMNKGNVKATAEGQKRHMEDMARSDSDLQLAIVEKDSDILVGTVGLHKINNRYRTAEISIVIGEPSAWGKGYGTAAVSLMVNYGFNELSLHKISSGMWSGNVSSEKCFIKNGFKHEGTKRQQFMCEGEYVDELCYGLLRSEWGSQGEQ